MPRVRNFLSCETLTSVFLGLLGFDECRTRIFSLSFHQVISLSLSPSPSSTLKNGILVSIIGNSEIWVCLELARSENGVFETASCD